MIYVCTIISAMYVGGLVVQRLILTSPCIVDNLRLKYTTSIIYIKGFETQLNFVNFVTYGIELFLRMYKVYIYIMEEISPQESKSNLI